MSRRLHTCGAKSTDGPSPTAALQLCCFALALLFSTGALAGKLDEVRDATDEGSGDDSGGDDSGDDDSGGDGSGAAEALAGAVGDAFLDAIYSAAAARAARVRFSRYPYAGGFGGWIVPDATGGGASAYGPEAAAPLPRASFRFSMDYAYDWDRVHRPAISLALDTSSGLGLRADFTHYVERLPGGGHDYLGIGTLDAAFRMLDAPRAALYSGLGWRYLVDGEAFRNGFNGLLAVDVFPVRPLVVSAILEGGNLGAGGFFHGRVSLGALVQRLEIFVGYDAVVVGGGPGGEVVFHGPVAGIRGWL